uniref:Uncharacterized protein n=1 Tax=Anguilla anguilla TaxID=7936 RepID=A0A0E9U868_ANGAN
MMDSRGLQKCSSVTYNVRQQNVCEITAEFALCVVMYNQSKSTYLCWHDS